MFPYVLDRKYSINNNLLATEHNKTSQVIEFTIELGHYTNSIELVSILTLWYLPWYSHRYQQCHCSVSWGYFWQELILADFGGFLQIREVRRD